MPREKLILAAMLSAVMATACGAVTTGTHPSSPSAALPTHGSPLAVSSQTFPQGDVSLTYPNVTMSATGGAPPYTWTLRDGALPGGLMLAPDGTTFGVPTAAGTFTFVMLVYDHFRDARLRHEREDRH